MCQPSQIQSMYSILKSLRHCNIWLKNLARHYKCSFVYCTISQKLRGESRNSIVCIVYISWKCLCQANKIHIFWEDHKILRNHPLIFDASWQLKEKGGWFRENFMAFEQNLNFMTYVILSSQLDFNLQRKSRKKSREIKESQIRVHQVISVANLNST